MNAKDILKKAATIQDERAEQRDSPRGERTMGKAINAFNAITGKGLAETDGWLLMCCLKMARGQHGVFVADDYDDLVGYASLYGEAAYGEQAEKLSKGATSGTNE